MLPRRERCNLPSVSPTPVGTSYTAHSGHKSKERQGRKERRRPDKLFDPGIRQVY